MIEIVGVMSKENKSKDQEEGGQNIASSNSIPVIEEVLVRILILPAFLQHLQLILLLLLVGL